MRAILMSLASLLSATFLVQASNKAITTMIGVSIAERGGSQSDVALIAASYSIGFLVGCILSPSIVPRIGLIRAFTAATALLTVTIIALDLFDAVTAWALLRLLMGASLAAVLAVADTWINDRTPNDRRGRVIAVYSIVAGLAAITSQLVFLTLDAQTDGFVLLFAIAMNIAVVMVAITSAKAPEVKREPRKSLLAFTSTSMTANVAVFTHGFMVTAIISIFPFYGTDHGVSENIIALALATLYLGRLVFQWPLGTISDRFDRSSVLAGMSLFLALVTLLILVTTQEFEGRNITGAAGTPKQVFTFVVTFMIGGALLPMYSIASALAFDRAEGRPMINISTTLLILNAAGAVAGPFTVMFASNVFGDYGLWVCILIASSITAATALLRRIAVGRPEAHTPAIVDVPTSSVEMARAAAELTEEGTQERARQEASRSN